MPITCHEGCTVGTCQPLEGVTSAASVSSPRAGTRCATGTTVRVTPPPRLGPGAQRDRVRLPVPRSASRRAHLGGRIRGDGGRTHAPGGLRELNCEIPRRADVVGVFRDRASIVRLCGAVLAEEDGEWAEALRYMSPETFAKVDAALRSPERTGAPISTCSTPGRSTAATRPTTRMFHEKSLPAS